MALKNNHYGQLTIPASVESEITQNSVAMKEILDGFGINTDKIYVYYSRTGEELEIGL